MPRVVTLHSALPIPAPVAGATGAPREVHLVPAGTFRGTDGRGPYHLRDAEAVIRASLPSGERLVLDENHSTDLVASRGGEAPARGWIVALHARADGIWGEVEWTPTGDRLVVNKEYRGISPAIAHDAAGNITRVLRASLTNDPNLTDLATLHSRDTTMHLTKLRLLLGLPADADEAAILAAVGGRADLVKVRAAFGLPETATEAEVLAAAEAARAAAAARADEVRKVAEAAGVPEAKDLPAVTVALQARTASAGTQAQEIVALQTRVTELVNKEARRAAEAFIDGAMKEGKPILPVVREHYVTRHMKEPAAVETEVKAMPSLHAGGLGFRAAEEAANAGVTPEQNVVAKAFGLDPKKLAAYGRAA